MRNVLVVLSLMLGLMVPSLAHAQSDPAPSSSAVTPNQVMSGDDIAKLREQMNAISKALGNASPPAPADSSKPAAPPKSMSEVASKAVDMMGSGANKVVDMIGSAVGTLSTNLSKIAPQVWRIMIIQQYAKAANELIVPILLLVLTGVVAIVLRKNFPPPPAWTERWTDADSLRLWLRTIIPTLFLCWFGVWFVVGMSEAVRYLINPEYYAIKDILMLITNPSGAVATPTP